MRHCLLRAKDKKRFDPDATEFDVMMIEILISLGFAKEMPLKNKYGDTQYGRRLYHLRYGGKLVAPIVADDDGRIITFMPTGKRISSKKYYESRIDENQVYKQKRLKKRGR